MAGVSGWAKIASFSALKRSTWPSSYSWWNDKQAKVRFQTAKLLSGPPPQQLFRKTHNCRPNESSVHCTISTTTHVIIVIAQNKAWMGVPAAPWPRNRGQSVTDEHTEKHSHGFRMGDSGQCACKPISHTLAYPGCSQQKQGGQHEVCRREEWKMRMRWRGVKEGMGKAQWKKTKEYTLLYEQTQQQQRTWLR